MRAAIIFIAGGTFLSSIAGSTSLNWQSVCGSLGAALIACRALFVKPEEGLAGIFRPTGRLK